VNFNFAKSQTVDSLDDVPETYRGLYVEKDGKFVIADFAKGIVADFNTLQGNLATANNVKKKANDEAAKTRIGLKAFTDLLEEMGVEVQDDDAAKALKAHIEGLGKNSGDAATIRAELKTQFDKARQTADKTWADKLAAKDTDLGAMQGTLSKHLIGSAGAAALAARKGNVKLLMPHIQGSTKVIRGDDGEYRAVVLDGTGNARLKADGSEMSVDDLVEEMKKSTDFAGAFESEVQSGGGKKPGQQQQRQVTNGQTKREDMSPAEKQRAGLAARGVK